MRSVRARSAPAVAASGALASRERARRRPAGSSSNHCAQSFPTRGRIRRTEAAKGVSVTSRRAAPSSPAASASSPSSTSRKAARHAQPVGRPGGHQGHGGDAAGDQGEGIDRSLDHHQRGVVSAMAESAGGGEHAQGAIAHGARLGVIPPVGVADVHRHELARPGRAGGTRRPGGRSSPRCRGRRRRWPRRSGSPGRRGSARPGCPPRGRTGPAAARGRRPTPPGRGWGSSGSRMLRRAASRRSCRRGRAGRSVQRSVALPVAWQRKHCHAPESVSTESDWWARVSVFS